MNTALEFTAGLGAGLVGWTLLEYVIHRGFGHALRGNLRMSVEHRRHHADILYFSPLALKLLGAVPVLGALLLLAGGLFGWTAGSGFVLATALGWAAYEWLHEYIHVKGPRTAYHRWAVRHHLSHHFGHPHANFGVTTPLWDWVFRSHVPVARVRIPAHKRDSLPWIEPGREYAGLELVER